MVGAVVRDVDGDGLDDLVVAVSYYLYAYVVLFYLPAHKKKLSPKAD